MNCPICAKPLDGGELVMVCHPCHKSLAGASLSLSSTGEFRVPVAAELFLGSEGAANLEPTQAPAATPNACAWCNKREPEVKKLLGRSNVALCNECVSLASDIMEAELGADWR